MPKAFTHPKSQQRLRILEIYRGRGRRTNSLWLVYSVKTQRDLILTSDLHLIHWLTFLETDARVKSFEHLNLSDNQNSISIEVICSDGTTEQHYINVLNTSSTKPSESSNQIVKRFSSDSLRPLVSLAMRWLKAISFAAAIRDLKVGAARTALAKILNSRSSGDITSLLHELDGFEPSVIIGLLVQLAVQGKVSIDLAEQSLNPSTNWKVCNGEFDVVT